MDRLLTVKEIKEIFNFSNDKTYRLINSPGFPKIKIGKQYRIPEDELNRWIKKYAYSQYIM